MTFEDGSGIFRISADAIDQPTDAMIRAIAPGISIGAPPRFNVRLISTATPASPIIKDAASRNSEFLRFKKNDFGNCHERGNDGDYDGGHAGRDALFGPE